MDFALTDNQESIRDAIAKICARFDDAYWLKKDKEGGFPADFHQALAEAGWLGICMPEEYGGSGLGITEAAIMMQAIAESGAGMSGASAIHINIFGLNPVVVFGTEEQKQRMLPPIIDGQGEGLLRRHRAQHRPEHHAAQDPRGARRRPLCRQRPEGLDLHRAGRRQDPAAGAHHAAGRGQEADPRPQPVLHRLRPHRIEVREIEKMGRKAVDSNEVFFDGLRDAGRGPHRRGGQGLRIHPARPEPRAHPDRRRGGRPRPRWRCNARRATPRSASCSTARSARTRRSSIRWPKNWMELEAAWLMTMYGGLALRQRPCPAARRPMPPSTSPREAGFDACEHAMMTHGGFGYAKEFHVERYLREVADPAHRAGQRRS